MLYSTEAGVLKSEGDLQIKLLNLQCSLMFLSWVIVGVFVCVWLRRLRFGN